MFMIFFQQVTRQITAAWETTNNCMMSQKCFSVKGLDSSRQVTILRTMTTVLILKNMFRHFFCRLQFKSI